VWLATPMVSRSCNRQMSHDHDTAPLLLSLLPVDDVKGFGQLFVVHALMKDPAHFYCLCLAAGACRHVHCRLLGPPPPEARPHLVSD
jgi:hypothetical protein